MAWEININDMHSIIEVKLSGTVISTELEHSIMAAYDLAENNCIYSLFYDCANVTGGLEVHDIIMFMRSITAINEYYKVKYAVLKSLETALESNFRFLDNSLTNKGVSVKVCDDRKMALSWLS